MKDNKVRDGARWWAYNDRNRLIAEQRIGQNPYAISYTYDTGGNRLMKTDILMARRVEYHYDLENPALYGSKNNRLMYHETFETQSETKLSTTWYYYTMAGNVRRIVTLDEDSVGRVVDLPEHREHPAGDVASGFIPGADQSRDREGAVKEHPARPGSLRSSGEVAGAGNTTGPYTSIRFEYPCNGEPVQYVAGEDWLLDPDVNDGNPIQVRVNWAREFRYDAARLRYMNRTLNGGHFKNSNVVDESRSRRRRRYVTLSPMQRITRRCTTTTTQRNQRW